MTVEDDLHVKLGDKSLTIGNCARMLGEGNARHPSECFMYGGVTLRTLKRRFSGKVGKAPAAWKQTHHAIKVPNFGIPVPDKATGAGKRIVKLFSRGGRPVAWYDSVVEAARSEGVSASTISRACRNGTRSRGGYCWEIVG